MAEWGDIISRIFSTGRTQGLSGAAEAVLDPDPANSFYASRLRKHHADGDLVDDPGQIWSSASFGGRKGGLLAHLMAERGEGPGSFTDVLIIVNAADAKRAAAWSGAEPWAEHASQLISMAFDRFAAKEGFLLPHPRRPLRYWFISDGSKEMLNQSYGLAPGEFVTGLLPNLYIGPSANSRPVLSVHMNLPGVWEGYKEVGQLYSDQLLFTLGRHWLDNFHHPALQEPGLYRLQQLPSGTLIHEISPELQDRYIVRSDRVDGASVITIVERDGRPLAFLVLAVMDVQAEAPSAHAQPGSGASAPQMQTLRTISVADAGKKTIVPGEISGRTLTLQERGALLQKVHFSAFMEGYDVYVGSNGQMATMLPAPRATIQVRGRKVTLLSQSEGVRVGNRPLPVGQSVPLQGEMEINIDGHPLQYRDLSDIAVEGWPYLGELRRPGMGTYLEFGGSFRIGRDRRCKVRLPDEPHNDNICWLPQVDNGTTIRARNGEIPKSRFYTDSIMVASEHLELDLSREPAARSMARHCYSFIRRGTRILPLFPREGSQEGTREATLEAGDELLVGNCLFGMTWPPAARSGENRTHTRPPTFLNSIEIPMAGGLGEQGLAPKPIIIENLAQDSISIPSSRLAPPPPQAPPLQALPDVEDPVVYMKEEWCASEVSRPARLLQFGWVVNGELVVGNNRNASAILPELLSSPDQAFLTLEYFRIRSQAPPIIELLQPGEARLEETVREDGREARREVERSRLPLQCRMWVVRCDVNFEPSFEIELFLTVENSIPGGRAWVLHTDLSRPRVAPLFTTGLSLNTPRSIRLGSVDLRLLYDGRTLAISDYAQGWRQSDGSFPPLANGDGQSQMATFPADGGTVHLHPGNWLLVGNQLYRFQVGSQDRV